MSEQNVEACRRVLEALGTRRDVDAGLPYFDPEVEFRSAIIGGAEGNAYRGHDGVRAWMAESDAIWVDLRVDADEFRDLGDDVLMLGRLHAQGRESGVEIDSPMAWLFTLRDERIVRARGYLDPQEALRAAGLSGPARG
jgi:ketosteroid isomerase-like protein